MTRTAALSEAPSTRATIVAVPAAPPRTRPVLSTVATAGVRDCQTT